MTSSWLADKLAFYIKYQSHLTQSTLAVIDIVGGRKYADIG